MTTLTSVSTGTEAADRIVLGGGNDTIDGGMGSDILLAGAGDDTLVYTLAKEQNVLDVYNGGSGKDTLVLDFSKYSWTTETWSVFKASLTQRIMEFEAMVKTGMSGNGELPNAGAKSFVFDFGDGRRLEVSMIEKVIVIAPTLSPSNTPATIGAPDVAHVQEDAGGSDGQLTAAGTIAISDPDAGQAFFRTTVTGADGNLGTLTLDAGGSYVYAVDNSATQFLGAGQSHVDTFTVTSVDGTAVQVRFTIDGVNDAADIGDPAVAVVQEDVGPIDGKLTASGTLSIRDADAGQASFRTAVSPAGGNLGALTLDAGGGYVYAVDNTATQFLGAGVSHRDVFSITSLDGTTHEVTFTIEGVNDAADIGDPDAASVQEDVDVTDGKLTTSGTLSIRDADAGQAGFSTTVLAGSGNLGTLTLEKTGAYTYSVDNDATQFLGAGQSQIDTFTVTSLDGTTRELSFTILGSAEAGPTRTLINGDDGNNALNGTDADEEINGAGGNDLIHGNGGNDLISGGNGDDWIDAGDGDDVVDGGNGMDEVYGGNGDDTISGGAGQADYLQGGSGNDTIYGGGQNYSDPDGAYNELNGGAGNDLLYGGSAGDMFRFDASPVEGESDQIYRFDGNGDLIGLSRQAFGLRDVGSFDLKWAPQFAQVALDPKDLPAYDTGSADTRIIANQLVAGQFALYYDPTGGSMSDALLFATVNVMAGDFDGSDFRLFQS